MAAVSNWPTTRITRYYPDYYLYLTVKFHYTFQHAIDVYRMHSFQ